MQPSRCARTWTWRFSARFTLRDPIPEQEAADTLAALDQLGHRDFGVTLTVTTGGEIAVGDELELI